MTNQRTQGSVDRHYLKAMGIDLWAERDAITAGKIPESATATQQVTSKQSTASEHLVSTALAEMSAAELAGVVGRIQIALSGQSHDAVLLVVTNDPALSDESGKLLESMLKAIELESTHWLHAVMLDADSSAEISAVEKSFNPKVVLFMLRTGGNATALKQLRSNQHQCVALQASVFVTFHPQDLLDNPELKRPAWEDLKLLRQWL